MFYDDFAAKVRDLTGGRGVAVVYDGVGAATFDDSLAALRIRGTPVIFGTASGPTPPLGDPAAQPRWIALRHQALGRALHRDHRRAPPPHRRRLRLDGSGNTHGEHRRAIPDDESQ